MAARPRKRGKVPDDAHWKRYDSSRRRTWPTVADQTPVVAGGISTETVVMTYTLLSVQSANGRRTEASGVRPRSVIPGRQRWDVAVVLGRPSVADLLEAGLRKSPGVGMVRANPITGRLLIHHDTGLSRADVEQLVRHAVSQLVWRAAGTPSGFSGSEPGVALVPGGERPHTAQTKSLAARPLTVAGGAVALAWVAGRFLVRSPLVRLVAVAATTVVVVWRGWRRSQRSQQNATLSTPRHPLLRIVGPHRRKFYLASFLSVLGQVLDMTPALSIGVIFSLLMVGGSAFLAGLGLATVPAQLWFVCGATALVSVTAAVVSVSAGRLWRELAQSVQHDWRTGMYAHVQRVELGQLEGERTTRLARVLIDDVNNLGRFFATSANDIIQLVTSAAVFVSVFLVFAPNSAWLVFLPIPIIAWSSFRYQERATSHYAVSSEDESLLASQLINNLEASATVKSFGAEDYEIDRIHRFSEACQASSRQIDTAAVAYPQVVRRGTIVSFVGFLLLGGGEVLDGVLSFGVFTALLSLPAQVMVKLPVLGGAVDQYQRTVTSLKRVLDLRTLPVESTGTGRPLRVAAVTGELVFDGVTFAYPGRPPVLEDLSLRIGAGQTTGIVGITGAGKTTIAKLLLRFHDVSSGRVLLDGHDIRDVRLQDLRSAIGFVSQDAFLFDGTVRENISYGSFDADPQQVAMAARLAEADDFIEALPTQYDSLVGERGATLSGGQKQRISLARVIVKDAPIMILDEATSALDNETEAAVYQTLTNFFKGHTMVVIAHRLSTIRHADWIYVLGRGVVIEQGVHDELLAHGGVYASLWRRQIGEVHW